MIIDTHVHIADPCPRDDANELKEAELLSIMDEYGVEKVWISSVAGLYATGDYPASNKYMYELSKCCGNRIVPFFTVNPNYGVSTLEEIKRCTEEYGFRGMKFHPWLQAFPVTLPIINCIIEECIRYKLPLLFHDGTPPYSSTLQIANLAERFPEATVILGHAGNVEAYANAILAAQRLPNIYLCLSGPSISQLQAIVQAVEPSKLMFGSDFGMSRNPAPLKYRLQMWDYVELNSETRNMIFYRNAADMLS